jgi:hypothetical protein
MYMRSTSWIDPISKLEGLEGAHRDLWERHKMRESPRRWPHGEKKLLEKRLGSPSQTLLAARQGCNARTRQLLEWFTCSTS